VVLAAAALGELLAAAAAADITELVPLERLALRELAATVPMMVVVALLVARGVRGVRGVPELLCHLLLPAESLRVPAEVVVLAAQVEAVAQVRIPAVVVLLVVMVVMVELVVMVVMVEVSLFFILQPLSLTARP